MTETACACAHADGPIDLQLIDAVFVRHADDPGALIPILQETQAVYGYLPREALAEIARRRSQPYAEVYGVATFYAQFHLSPRGKVIIKICTGTACHVAGAPELMTALADEMNVAVGATSDDLRFTIEAVACVGCCGLAPVVVVDDKPHGQLDAGKARRLAKQLLREVTS